MNRALTDTEIEDLLRAGIYGHLGCTMPSGQVYIVPMTYAYYDNAIYGFTYSGQKTTMLRSHPSACFQVEQSIQEGTWNSVITWGTYEEIQEPEHLKTIDILTERLQREGGKATSALYNELLPKKADTPTDKERVFFRIRIEEKTGMHIQND